MLLCYVFSKSPVNVLSYFHNLKKKEKKKRVRQSSNFQLFFITLTNETNENISENLILTGHQENFYFLGKIIMVH